MFQSTVTKLLPLVLVFVTTSNPLFRTQQTASPATLSAPRSISLDCCAPDPTCGLDQTCAVSGTLVKL